MNFIEALEVSDSLYHPDYGSFNIISVDTATLEVFMESDLDEIVVPIDRLKGAKLFSLKELNYED